MKTFFFGFLLGIANLIPGVSGGTFALILGIYDRVLSIPARLSIQTLTEFINVLRQPQRVSGLKQWCQKYDLIFAAILGAGAATAIFTLSALMAWLLKFQFVPTYAFFLGLVAFSISTPLKMIKRFDWLTGCWLAIGLVLTIATSTLGQPEEKVLKKSELYRQEVMANQTTVAATGPSSKTDYSKYVIAFACGALAISATILPGISGSLLLLLLGQYFYVIQAIRDLPLFRLDDWLFLTSFSFGMIAGVICFSRLLKILFEKQPDRVLGFLTGLVIGSLYTLWPFKQVITLTDFYEKVDGQIVHHSKYLLRTTGNVIPGNLTEIWLAMAALIAGIIIMWLFLKKNTVKP